MAFTRRWKPSAAQKKAYTEKLIEAEKTFNFITSNFPIRVGCYVEYVDKSTNNIIAGDIIKSSYEAKTGQHTFTILAKNGDKVLVKGRNIYDRLLRHDAGDIAKNWNKTTNNIETENFDVTHKTFGFGKILNERGSYPNIIYDVTFKDFGEKTILSSYLEKIAC